MANQIAVLCDLAGLAIFRGKICQPCYTVEHVEGKFGYIWFVNRCFGIIEVFNVILMQVSVRILIFFKISNVRSLVNIDLSFH